MPAAPVYVGKIHSLIEHGWPWVLAAPALLALILVVVPIGLWISVARRNRILEQQVTALKYQTEVLKWLGQLFGGSGQNPELGPRKAT